MQKQKKMLPIKENDEKTSSSKIVTKESSISNPSFRVYYGGNPIAVPFVWEAKPGTPKHTKHNLSNNEEEQEEEENKDYLPPLTPPPSYYLKKPNKSSPSNGTKKFSSKIFLGFFPKHRRQISSSTTSSSSSSSLSTLSCPSSSMLVPDPTMRSSEQSPSLSLSLSRARKGRTLSSPGSLFDLLVNGQEDDEQEQDHEDVRSSSPRSVLCFGCVGSRRIRTCSVV